MNSSIENAFAAWLVDAEIVLPIHTGASTEEFDPEQLALIVSVPDVEHSVGPLHRATVNLVVTGPAYHTSVQSYREAALGIRGVVDDHANSGLAALIGQQAGASFGGIGKKCSLRDRSTKAKFRGGLFPKKNTPARRKKIDRPKKWQVNGRSLILEAGRVSRKIHNSLIKKVVGREGFEPSKA